MFEKYFADRGILVFEPPEFSDLPMEVASIPPAPTDLMPALCWKPAPNDVWVQGDSDGEFFRYTGSRYVQHFVNKSFIGFKKLKDLNQDRLLAAVLFRKLPPIG